MMTGNGAKPLLRNATSHAASFAFAIGLVLARVQARCHRERW
jgi:hypothetical protein